MLQVDQHWIQLGIVSFGNKCGEPSYPGDEKKFRNNINIIDNTKFFTKCLSTLGVYTRVSEYMDWIRENTKDD